MSKNTAPKIISKESKKNHTVKKTPNFLPKKNSPKESQKNDPKKKNHRLKINKLKNKTHNLPLKRKVKETLKKKI